MVVHKIIEKCTKIVQFNDFLRKTFENELSCLASSCAKLS